MKRATFTILFYLKRKKKKDDGPLPIYARVTINSQRTEFSLNKSLEKDEWSKEKGCVSGYTNPAKQMNAYLDMVRSKLYWHKVQLEDEGKETTAIAIKNAFLGIERCYSNFYTQF